ncbi:unnamed protein product [Urochloa humidicola]
MPGREPRCGARPRFRLTAQQPLATNAGCRPSRREADQHPEARGSATQTLPSARDSPGSVSMRSGCWAQARPPTSAHGEEEQRSAASSKGQSQYLTPEALTLAR